MQFRKGAVKPAEHQQRLLSEPMEAPSLDIFHSPLCMIMDKWLQVPLLEKVGGKALFHPPGDLPPRLKVSDA